jgi:FlaA1/EpsC-like NDP-sugar epimerase
MTLGAKFSRANRQLLGRLLSRLNQIPRSTKTAILLVMDLSVLTLVSFSAFEIRFGGERDPTEYQIWLLLLAPPITCVCLFALRAYGNVARLHASSTEGALVLAIGISALMWSFIILVLGAEGFPRSVVVLYGGLSTIVYIALRRMIAWLFRLSHTRRSSDTATENVAILGVNEFGSSLVQSLRAGGVSRPVAFLDSDAANIGRRVAGLPVIALTDIREAIVDLGVDTIILALTQRSRQRDRTLIAELSELDVKVQTIAPPEDILSGHVSISDIRPVNIEDVLGRDPIVPRRGLMERAVAGQRLLVTGAGGSIGSELVRQALGFSPTMLILFELSEIALYEIERETQALAAASGVNVEIVPVLGSVCDRELVTRIMTERRVEVVLHAAAYKHVPLGESNAASCLTNNVFGAQVLADCAIAAGVKLFVLISSDKAVRPTNIMGASKRMAELVLQDRASRQPATTFTMVRFGNVLGSSGSVLPLFRDQIAKGGPITVTDPRMVRYFMTIPESVQLVLQAAGMARGGEVFVLDMGEPVQIDALARTLVRLSNLSVRDAAHPNGDIEIVYSGMRPGEKLYEELLIGDNVVETDHPRIMRCLERSIARDRLQAAIEEIGRCARVGDDEALRRCVSDTVEEYQPDATSLAAE